MPLEAIAAHYREVINAQAIANVVRKPAGIVIVPLDKPAAGDIGAQRNTKPSLCRSADEAGVDKVDTAADARIDGCREVRRGYRPGDIEQHRESHVVEAAAAAVHKVRRGVHVPAQRLVPEYRMVVEPDRIVRAAGLLAQGALGRKADAETNGVV